ncbi:hypothetical protein Golob_004754 [Gossypium lobatum]|uniref:Transmembrane protein n=1 Tax=Gossypium lobatum TaxID=34289 RepID=A0A7J8N2M9_9ROSI|nr:hypothetical protein [Gossypium lobatum]
MSELWDFTHISEIQNNLQGLKEIWDQWDDETKQLFYYNYDFVPMWKLKIWGAIGYVTLLVLRQYRSMQFIPITQGLTQCEFTYKGNNYKKKEIGVGKKIEQLEEEKMQLGLDVDI